MIKLGKKVIRNNAINIECSDLMSLAMNLALTQSDVNTRKRMCRWMEKLSSCVTRSVDRNIN